MQRARFTLGASAALWGLALAVSIAPLLQRRAPASALPGAMAAAGVDAASPIRQLILIIALPLLGAFLARFVRQDGERWSIVTTMIALASAPLSLLAGGGPAHIVVHAIAALTAFAAGHIDARFSRRDAILIPTVLVAYFAFLDLFSTSKPITSFQIALIVVLVIRILGRSSHAFALAPLAILLPWPVAKLAWILISVFVSRLLQPAVMPKVVGWIVLPIFITAYPLALLGVHSPPHLDFFEDGHELLPASEMMRGERPYEDIVPVHSLLADGGIAYVVMKSGNDSASGILRTRLVLSALNLTAIYFVTLAATGSAEAALLAALLGVSLFPASTIWARSTAALFALAAALAGVRNVRPRWFLVSGVLLVLAFLMGMEFAVYSGVAALVAALRMRDWRRSLTFLAIGVAVAAVPMFILMALFRVADDFVRVTLGELLPAGTVYVPGPLEVPPFLKSPATLIAQAGQAGSLMVLLWIIALVTSAAMLMRRRGRADTPWIIGVWLVIAAVSFAQRRHVYYGFLLAPFIVAALLHLRRFDRRLFATLAIVAGIIAMPVAHIFAVATPLRLSNGVPTGDHRPLVATRRGGDAVAPPAIVAAIASARKFADSRLRPDETWFDFANASALYYFLERDAPARHHQVPFYETSDGQREVIAMLERNPRVRAVLMDFPGGLTVIDGVANRDRAPMVAAYIEENFRPDFAENGVVFWIRRSSLRDSK